VLQQLVQTNNFFLQLGGWLPTARPSPRLAVDVNDNSGILAVGEYFGHRA
jgi:hypothetical protein